MLNFNYQIHDAMSSIYMRGNSSLRDYYHRLDKLISSNGYTVFNNISASKVEEIIIFLKFYANCVNSAGNSVNEEIRYESEDIYFHIGDIEAKLREIYNAKMKEIMSNR